MSKNYRFHTIYLIININNGKSYIGKHSTNNIEDNYFGGGIYLNRAVKKYGKENFRKEILEFCNENELNKKEIMWIQKLNTQKPNGYNLTIGGDGGDTYSLLSKEEKIRFREKCSKINKGRKFSEEHKQKMRKPKQEDHKQKLRKPKCEEHRRKMKEAWKKRRETPVSEETRLKISKAGKGEKRSQECKDKISLANSKRIWKEGSKEKIRISRLNKSHSNETKNKIGRKYKCKYCEAQMNAGNLTRYHNENCKFKTPTSQSASGLSQL